MAKINKELLLLYAENSRMKLKDAASTLKKSPQRLKYSTRLLEKERIIHNPHCVFDYSHFGLILFRVYFKGGYISEKDKATTLKRLAENPYIVAIYELTGEFDLAIEIEAPNPSRFNKELKKVGELIKTLNNYKIVLNLVTHIYPKVYLTRNASILNELEKKDIIIGGDRKVKEFSKNEMEMAKYLLNEPLIRITSLSKKSGLNIKTVKSVIQSLKDKKIIRGFKYIIDIDKMDIYKFRLFLKLHNLSQEREAQLMEFMLNTKEIVQLNKTVGDWEMEIDIESTDKTRIRYLIHQLRQDFIDLIETFNIIEFEQYYKRSFLPSSLFTEEA